MVYSNTDLTIEATAACFAALGSPARLAVVLSLVRAGPQGLSVGEIQTRTGIAASTLAHHLRHLAAAGLIRQERAGRTTRNHAVYPRLESLAGYILSQCCAEAAPPLDLTEEAGA